MTCCAASSTAASPATSPGTGTKPRSSTRPPARARSSGTTTWPGRTPTAARSRSTARPGHMGSLPQNDAAIAKWAYVVRELIDARRTGELAFAATWPDAAPCGPSHLVFEGAQGFLPTHSLEEVKRRDPERVPDGDSAVSGRRGFAAGVHHLRCELRQAPQRRLRGRSELGKSCCEPGELPWTSAWRSRISSHAWLGGIM